MSTLKQLRVRFPHVYKEYLDRFVVGQDEAKTMLSNILFMHGTRSVAHFVASKDAEGKPEDSDEVKRLQLIERTTKKSVGLIYGPSGCGKTYMIKTVSKALGVPYLHVPCKEITPSGWKGTNMDEVLKEYVNANREDPYMPYGIFHLDEFDKIITSGYSRFSKDIQHGFLNVLEGGEFVGAGSGPGGSKTKKDKNFFNTNTLLIVITGSFGELKSEKLRHTPERSSTLGFSSNMAKPDESPTAFEDELISVGVSRELVGRISAYSRVNELTRDDLKAILTSKEGSIIDQYNQLLSMGGEEFEVGDEDIEVVLDECEKASTGARALQHALERRLNARLMSLTGSKRSPQLDEAI